MLHRRIPGSGRRAALFAGSAGLALVAGLLPGSVALAATDGAPAGAWAAACADVDSTYCVQDATITPVDGAPTPMAALGLTASAATLPDDGAGWMSWAVDGWADQPAEVTGGEITLVIRTGAFVPRLTTAVAAGLRVSRGGEDGDHTLTVTGRATPVAWTTGDIAADCAARQYCGEYDTMADDAGTGYRFEGRTQDLEGNDPAFVESLDGVYLATDAQARTDALTYDTTDPDPYLWLGMLGNPQLDRDGDPVRNFVTAWLPEAYFTATGTTGDDALTTGFDLVNASDGRSASVPLTATASDGGVRLDVPDIGVGAALGELKVYARPSGAAPGAAAPGPPHDVTVTGDQDAVQVEWQAPEWDGGSDVVGYRARAFSAETGGTVVSRCDAEADAESCEIYGLTDGETYYVAVDAISALGEGRSVGRAEVMAGDESEVLPPSEPLAVRVAAGPNRLAVTWQAPESDGGAPVDYYTVQAYTVAVGGEPVAECTADSPRLSCVLTGLTRGTRLYVGVTASNEAGDGPEQPIRPAGTPWTVSGTPRAAAATSARGKVTVTWAAPAVTGGTAVTGYRADLYPAARGGSPAVRCTAPASARKCVTGALKPGHTYYVAVTAINAVGVSVPSARVKVLVRR